MSLAIPIPFTDSLTVGRYNLTFKNIVDFSAIPNMVLPIEIPVGGKKIDLSQITRDETAGTLVLTIDVIENPVPILLIVVGVFTLLGLAGGYMVLDKVEKIVSNPVADIAVVAGIAILIFGIIKFGLK